MGGKQSSETGRRIEHKASHWALIGLSGLAFALRVAGLDFQSLWRDEVDAILFAREPLGALLHNFIEPGQNGPFYYLVLHPWLRLAGESAFALRFFSVVLGVLAVPLAYRLARRLFPQGALLAALLVATSPYLIWYSQEGKMYALVVALVLLSMERYLAAVERGGWHRWLTYLVVTAIAIHVHLIAALIVPAQALLFAVLRRQGRAGPWLPWLVSLAALSAPHLLILAWQLPLLLQPATTGYPFRPLHEMLFSLLVNYSLGMVQGATLWTLALFVALLLAAGLWWKDQQSRAGSLAILVCWLLVPVLGFFLITLIRPLFTARYLIFVLPAYLLLLAAGLAAVARRSRLWAGLLLVALLAVNGWGVWFQARIPLKADFRAATHYLTRHLAQDDLILFQIPYGRHSFDYYFRQRPASQAAAGEVRFFLPWLAAGRQEPYRWADGLYTNAGIEPGEVARHMARITAGSRVVWLVATEAALWDERGLVLAWLEAYATRTDAAHFVRVAVYRYELPP